MVEVDRPRLARVTALAAPAACLLLVALATDTPRLTPIAAPSSAAPRAALAIRDHVSPFEKLGSRTFTLPLLDAAYDRVHYFTQRGVPDGAVVEGRTYALTHGGLAEIDDHRASFVAALRSSLAECAHVDLFLLAHDNDYLAWMADLPAELRARLRLVYNSGCGNADQAHAWLACGADAYVAHRGSSESAVFYFFFLRRWVRDATLHSAVAAANQQAWARFQWVERCSLGAVPAAAIWRGTEAGLYGDGDFAIGSRP